MTTFEISNKKIGGEKTFVIAEVGSNHTGKLSLAKEHIDAVAETGADAVKFQSIDLDKLYKSPSQATRDLHAVIDMEESWTTELKDYADKKNLIFFSSPTYMDAVRLLDSVGVKLFKLASAQVGTFPQLVKAVAMTGKPTILSTGIADYNQVTNAVNTFREAGNNNFAVLHCNSIYPTPADKVFLGRMETYRRMFDCPVGFSDHTEGTSIVLAAVAMGANIIEKHFLLDTSIDSPDAPFSIQPGQFCKMVSDIRNIEMARINSPRLVLEKEESEFKEGIRYRLVLKNSKKQGEGFDESDFDFLRHPDGIDVSQMELVVENMRAANDIPSGGVLYWHSLQGKDK